MDDLSDIEWARAFIADAEGLAETHGANFGSFLYPRLTAKLALMRGDINRLRRDLLNTANTCEHAAAEARKWAETVAQPSETERNRLAYLFASMVADPRLSLRFIDVVQREWPIQSVEALRYEVSGWTEDHGTMTREGLQAVARTMRLSTNPSEKDAGRMLEHELVRTRPTNG